MVATIILCSPDICVCPPSPVIFLQTTKSTVLPPPLPIETTFQWVGAEKIIFPFCCIFHGYFLVNLAPRGPQLATKMAPAFLGLAGALPVISIWVIEGPQGVFQCRRNKSSDNNLCMHIKQNNSNYCSVRSH